jgi:NitT/TauT family transport system ATP-binding protein
MEVAHNQIRPIEDPRAAGAARPKISISQLALRYRLAKRELPVLADIDLDVREQEFVCLVGASGCGKSTLLNIVAGFVSPSAGEVLLDGHPVGPPGADRVMVFQDDAVFPWYTVRSNIEYGLRAAHVPAEARRNRVDQVLRMVGLEEFADAHPRELSGGMRKRCDMARALAIEPSVLLMDEPFASLDVITKERLQIEFLDLWTARRITVLFVTHDLEEALFLGDRVAVMRKGPGPFLKVIDVPFGRPREVELKTTPEFQLLRASLAHVITERVTNLKEQP